MLRGVVASAKVSGSYLGRFAIRAGVVVAMSRLCVKGADVGGDRGWSIVGWSPWVCCGIGVGVGDGRGCFRERAVCSRLLCQSARGCRS